MAHHNYIVAAIFVLTYVVVALGEVPWFRIDRTGAAIAGAVAMVASGALSESDAQHAVDFHTLALLLGMMIVVANLRLSGAFTLFARTLLSRAKSGFGMLAMTIAASGLLAAFFINDVVCLALTPLLIDAAELAGMDPVPLLLGLATASNIGSAATITGNPQNMIVAGFAHLGYADFALHLAPAALLGLIVDYAVIAAVYRKRLGGIRRTADMHVLRRRHILRPLLLKSSLVAIIAWMLFLGGFRTDLVAMGAGAFLLFTSPIRPQRVYHLIDWTMLAMFAGLFIVVAGLETTGFEADWLKIIGVGRLTHPLTLTAVVAILSNLVSNVPAVLLFRPIYPILGAGRAVALVIASASTYAGNLTVMGSIANLIVLEQARQRRVIVTFRDYMRVGVPITIATLAINAMFLHWLP